MPLKKDFCRSGGYMEVSDFEVERILDEQIYAAMKLLAVIYPPGCREVIPVPNEHAQKKSKNRLTLRIMVINLYKLIVNKGWLKMALTQCPECKKEISDSAPVCPGCGYALNPTPVKVIVEKKGIGCIGLFFVIILAFIIFAAVC
jgi:hypothetical protein